MIYGYVDVIVCCQCGEEFNIRFTSEREALDSDPETCPCCGSNMLECIDSVTITEKGNERMRFI